MKEANEFLLEGLYEDGHKKNKSQRKRKKKKKMKKVTMEVGLFMK